MTDDEAEKALYWLLSNAKAAGELRGARATVLSSRLRIATCSTWLRAVECCANWPALPKLPTVLPTS